MVVGIPCMANTNPKINKVYMNVITTLAGAVVNHWRRPRLVRRSRWITAAELRPLMHG